MTETNSEKRTWPAQLQLIPGWLMLPALIILVQYTFGWDTILQPWLTFSWSQLLWALALILLSYALRTLRLYDYFPEVMRGQWLGAWRLMLLHNLLNNLLPARTGELSFPML
ncbi:MAG: hypothetical protein R3E95_19245 [Thiolinea sp.]